MQKFKVNLSKTASGEELARTQIQLNTKAPLPRLFFHIYATRKKRVATRTCSKGKPGRGYCVRVPVAGTSCHNLKETGKTLRLSLLTHTRYMSRTNRPPGSSRVLRGPVRGAAPRGGRLFPTCRKPIPTNPTSREADSLEFTRRAGCWFRHKPSRRVGRAALQCLHKANFVLSLRVFSRLEVHSKQHSRKGLLTLSLVGQHSVAPIVG